MDAQGQDGVLPRQRERVCGAPSAMTFCWVASSPTISEGCHDGRVVVMQITVNGLFVAGQPAVQRAALDNYDEQAHRRHPNDQKRNCGPVVLKPMFAHAQRSFSIEG